MRAIRPQIVKKAAALGAVLVLSASLGPHAAAGNRAGSLDDSFSRDGTKHISFGKNPKWAEAEDVVVYRDRKTVVAGNVSGTGFAVARLRWDGRHDDDFGGNGKVLTRFAGGASADRIVQYDTWRVVVAGTAGREDIALARYRGNGRLDDGFGGDGRVRFPEFAPSSRRGAPEWVSELIATPGGKILVVNPGGVMRLLADGSLDNSFGNGGIVTVEEPFHPHEDSYPVTATLQDDGKLLVAGTVVVQPQGFSDPHSLIGVTRYNSDGSPDESFGDGGRSDDYFGDDNWAAQATDMLIQPDGKILVAGFYINYSGGDGEGAYGNAFIARYTVDGRLDDSFGRYTEGWISSGRLTASTLALTQPVLTLQPNGKIVAAGTAANDQMVLERYDDDGELDLSFSGNGTARVRAGKGSSSARAVALHPEGRLIVAGGANNRQGRTPKRFAVARLYR